MSSVPTNSAASSSARFLSSNHEGVLELTVKIAGLVVVVLPVVGVAIRFIAFAVGGVPNAIDMATRESVAGLASTAIQAVGAGVVTVAVLAFLAYRGFFVPMPPPGKYSPRRWVQARPWLRYVVYLVGLGIIALISGWPSGLVAGTSGVITGILAANWTVREDVTFFSVAAGVLLIGLIGAISAGLGGVVVSHQINDYRFAVSSGVPDGKYVAIGNSDGISYLDSCKGTGLIAVNQQQILEFHAVAPKASPSVSLIEIIRGASPESIGYHRLC